MRFPARRKEQPGAQTIPQSSSRVVCVCLNILDLCLPAQFIMQISWLAIFKSEHWLWLVSQASSARGSGCGNPHAFPPSPPHPTPISCRRCPPPSLLVSPNNDPHFLVCGWRNLTLHSGSLSSSVWPPFIIHVTFALTGFCFNFDRLYLMDYFDQINLIKYLRYVIHVLKLESLIISCGLRFRYVPTVLLSGHWLALL